MGKTASEFHTAACVTDFGAATLTAVGSLTLTGANGDAIFSVSTVIFDLTEVLSGISQLGALDVSGEITGGTGRFAGATGSLTATGVNDFSMASGTFSLNGTVSSVGSLKQ